MLHGAPSMVKQAYDQSPANVKERYSSDFVARACEGIASLQGKAGDPEQVYACIERAVVSPSPSTRYLVGYDAYFLWWPLTYLVPSFIKDFIFGKVFWRVVASFEKKRI